MSVTGFGPYKFGALSSVAAGSSWAQRDPSDALG